MADIHDQHKFDRDGFVKGEFNRDSFFELHQAQKETFDTQADRLDNFESRPGIQLNSISRLRVYVALSDPNLGPFINNAQSKAKLAYLTGTRNWHQHYVIDVADVDITLRGRAVHIRIMPADAFYFEFATSGNPVITATLVDELGNTFYSYKGCMVGVDVSLQKGTMVTRAHLLPRIANPPSGGPLKYRSIYGQEMSKIGRQYQIQLTHEPVNYTNTEIKYGRIRAKQTLFSAYAPGTPWTGVVLRDTDAPFATFGVTTACGPGGQFSARDYGMDVPYQDNEKSRPIRTALIRGAADWPRHNGKQLVTSKEFGDREFAIYVDAFNQFSIFPVGAIQPLSTSDPYAQNVPEFYVTRLAPALPSWAFVPAMKAKDYVVADPDPYHYVVDQPETSWKFNHLGTRCAAIMFEREEHKFDTTFWSTDSTAGCPMNSAKFNTWQSWMNIDTNFTQAFAPNTYNNTRYFIAPGIVELEIKIDITGPDLNQYLAVITVHELMRPSTNENVPYPLFIDYVWYDIPKRTNTNQEVKAGALVMLNLEYWMRPAGTLGSDTDRQILLSVRDFRSGAEIFSAVGAPVLAVDLTTLSLVLRLDAYSTDVHYVDGGATALNFPVHHFGAWIIHSGVGKEILYPENTPPAMKLKLQSYASLTGRAFLAAKMLTSTGWVLVPMTTPNDGWSNASFANLRNWWAYQPWYWYDQFYAIVDTDLSYFGDYVQYKSSGSPPGYPTDGAATETWLNAIGADWRNLCFCDKPRWGWHQYAALISGFVNVSNETTYFTHPNGSYAFWCDGWIYDRNGLPGDYVGASGAGGFDGIGAGTGLDYTHDTLAVYDATLVEHVIFDRVHFEVRATNQPVKSHNTSFLDLYNKAVKKAEFDKTLPDEDNIHVMELKDLRATFTKETGDDTNWEHNFLDLKMSWDGKDWWYRESAYMHGYASGTQWPPLVGSSGNFNNLNTYCFWRTTNYAGAGIAYPAGAQRRADPTHWHRRFANALIIMEK